MGIRVQFDGSLATIEDYRWTSEDFPEGAEGLNGLLNPLGPSGSDPMPDYTEAVRVAKLLNGRVLDKPAPFPIDPKVEY